MSAIAKRDSDGIRTHDLHRDRVASTPLLHRTISTALRNRTLTKRFGISCATTTPERLEAGYSGFPAQYHQPTVFAIIAVVRALPELMGGSETM